ncbi:MAG: peptide chain release factor 1 [Kiritimatiellae bacterium]|nr:peptide chain release factor 1 [Kiritimatiellia bacterium]
MIDPYYLEKLKQQMGELEEKLAHESGSGHHQKLRKLLEEHATLKRIEEKAAPYFRMTQELKENQTLLDDEQSDDEIKELARIEIEELQEKLPSTEKDFMIALLPADPVENRNIIMEIRAGTGGEEAALFAGDLFRIYSRYSENKGWKVNMIDTSPSQVGGYKEIIFSIEGTQVYKTMRYESGGHRVQRVPTTETNGRIHTSAATVAVLPEADEIDEIEIKPEDLRIDVYRASGAGGQHVNTTDSAVRITHLPTNTIAQSQDERSQHRNKDKAMKVLKARLLDKIREEKEAKTASSRKSQIGSGDRSERIRTYNFPQNRLTDHRINLTLYSLDQIIEGHLDELLLALYNHEVEKRLEEKLKSMAS